MGTGRIGVLGGTFDPIHIGHLIMAVELRRELDLDRVLFVPAGDPPHKPGMPISPAADRVTMLQLGIDARDGLEIDRVDLDRNGPSFTKDTLAVLAGKYPGARLVFLMGADSLHDLPSWNDPDRILELAEIGVASRPDTDLDLERVYEALPAARGRITMVEIPLIGISSSALRTRVAAGIPITFQVPDSVERYISDHGLYRP